MSGTLYEWSDPSLVPDLEQVGVLTSHSGLVPYRQSVEACLSTRVKERVGH